MAETGVATINGTNTSIALSAGYSPEQVDLIKRTVMESRQDDPVTDNELKLFLMNCQRTQLDPFTRQIYGIKRGGKLVIQISIDGMRLIAERSAKYGGQIGPYWCGDDGEWKDVWLGKTPPSAAKVGVIRTDWKETLWAVAVWREYVQTTRDNVPNRQWSSMPATMLAKCAESLALRRALPHEMSGLYTTEEMSQADRGQPEPEASIVHVPNVGRVSRSTGEIIDQEPPKQTPAPTPSPAVQAATPAPKPPATNGTTNLTPQQLRAGRLEKFNALWEEALGYPIKIRRLLDLPVPTASELSDASLSSYGKKLLAIVMATRSAKAEGMPDAELAEAARLEAEMYDRDNAQAA